MASIITSKVLVPISSEIIQDGAVYIENDIVKDFGKTENILKQYPHSDIKDYSDSIVLPGFINAHCHLELSALENKIEKGHSFSNWIIELGQNKRKLSQEEIIEGIEKGVKLLYDSGTVAVGDISSEYLSFDILNRSPLSGRVFWEFLAVDPDTIETRFNYLKKSFQEADSNRIKKGISPHSTYTLHQKAFDTINSYILKEKLYSTIHVGESSEEEEFFKYRIGGLFSFINNFYPIYDNFKNTSPLNYLHNRNYLLKDSLIVHLNILEEKDIQILKDYKLSVVHCPLSHKYFNHPKFKLEKLLENNINICLGTDSLASNEDLNMFKEMQRLKEIYPDLSNKSIVEMATLNSAKALNLDEGFGEIKIGKEAHLIALLNNSKSDPYEKIVFNKNKIKHL